MQKLKQCSCSIHSNRTKPICTGRGSFGNSPQGGLLMYPLKVLSRRFYKTWPRISFSAMGCKGIVYLQYSWATLATHKGGKTLGLSASSAISRKDQTISFVRMHSVRACGARILKNVWGPRPTCLVVIMGHCKVLKQ